MRAQHTLHDIAVGCWNGACNPLGLLTSLSHTWSEMPLTEKLACRDSEDLRVILDQIHMLVGPPKGGFKP